MKHRVADLEGARLDAAVAKAEGLPVHPGRGFHITPDTIDTVYADEIAPSRDWRDGGPIIERERIALNPHEIDRDCWYALHPVVPAQVCEEGPTPLIAAMRAYVASKFGEKVELP